MTRPPTRSELIDHMTAHRIAGEVATPRNNSLGKYRRLAEGDPRDTFGITLTKPWSHEDVLALMAQVVGVSPDPSQVDGPDRVDPELTADAVERLADRLRAAAERSERVILATGHPAGLLGLYQTFAAALARAGCEILKPADGEPITIMEYDRRGQVRYVGGVAMFGIAASLRHTHTPEPMQLMLSHLDGRLPGLVIADHGWAGAAGNAGIDAVGFADVNDPGLFAGEAEGKIAVAVPVDDNVLPALYAPLAIYVLDRAGLQLGDHHLW